MVPGLLTILCTSFVVALSGALMPGPLFTYTVSASGRHGAKTGPLMILGHGILELALVLCLMAGAAPLLQRDEVFVGIALAGGLVLFWMGVSMFRDLPRLTLRLDVDGHGQGRRGLVLSGILLSLANPYWIIWWASIGLAYITRSISLGVLGVLFFFCGHILADLAWYTMISFGVARGRRFFTDTAYRRLIGACAAFLLVFSGYFFYSGIARLI